MNNIHLMRPTTPGQIYELFLAGKLNDSDFESALAIIEKQVNMLSIILRQCENWQVEDIVIELEKYKILHYRMNESQRKPFQGQKVGEHLILADRNWKNAELCSSNDERLVHIVKSLGNVCNAGIDPIEFIVSKVRHIIITA